MSLDFSRSRLPPFAHQREDTEFLTTHPYVFIASEMRTGKSKIVIDAAQFLYEAGTINKVIIIAPAPVRRHVWADKDIGQLTKHLWVGLPALVTEFHEQVRMWHNGDLSKTVLEIYVTNYEFIRSKSRLKELYPACGPRTLLVLDESSFVNNHSSQQSQACLALRRKCGRVVLLNGTPIFHSPKDLFSQGNILHPSILECKYITQYLAKYAVEEPVLRSGGEALTKTVGKGKFTKEIVIKRVSGWREEGLLDLERRFAPVTIRRLQKECLDIPPKLDPVTLTAVLDASWPSYKQMRNDLVVWLKSGHVSVAATAAIKALRLSQITSGYLGGIEDSGLGPAKPEPVDSSFLDSLDLSALLPHVVTASTDRATTPVWTKPETPPTRSYGTGTQIGREKIDLFLWFIEQQLVRDPNLHIVSWSRFRPEAFLAVQAVAEKFPQFQTATLVGSQTKDERSRALSLLHPDTSPVGPCYVAGIEGTGSFGLDMCAAHTCVTLSSGYSHGRSAQTLDRVYGPNQKFPIAYYNVIAVGPKGQKTIDHDILMARQTGENVATRTAAAWVKVITEE
jgi:hypothetical protein